jgi:hypothetical protein
VTFRRFGDNRDGFFAIGVRVADMKNQSKVFLALVLAEVRESNTFERQFFTSHNISIRITFI